MTERGRDWLLAASFFASSILVRIPFQSERLFHGDSYGLAAGVMYTLTAHPPGFIGYCALVRLAYFLVGDVNFAFVVINILSTGIATALTYLLGRHMFGRTEGVVAAVIFGTSLDTSYFSVVALTYAAEGAFATAAGLTAWMSLKSRSVGWLLAHSFVLGVGGSVRQTTLAFLLPLWAFVVLRAAPRWRHRAAALLVLVLVVWSWAVPNARRLAKYWDKSDISYFESVYRLQVAMKQYYDSATFGKVDYEPETPRFHWPLVELGVALWNEVRPPAANAPVEVRTASASNALRMLRYQSAKLLFYVVVAMGLGAIFLLAALMPSVRATFDREKVLFLSLWIIPSSLFFALNHLGAWGYLLIYLAALAVISARAITVVFAGQERARRIVVATIVIVNVSMFLLMRPLPETSDRNRTINIALLQYGAPAISMSYARSRAKGYTSDPRQLDVDCVSDECLERDLPRAFGLPPEIRPVQPLRRSTTSN